MKYGVLKSLIGKRLCVDMQLVYCHVDRILVIEGEKAIVTAILKTINGRIMHWFLEAEWKTDAYGIHKIVGYKILKEDELYEYTQGRQPVQADSEGL